MRWNALNRSKERLSSLKYVRLKTETMVNKACSPVGDKVEILWRYAMKVSKAFQIFEFVNSSILLRLHLRCTRKFPTGHLQETFTSFLSQFSLNFLTQWFHFFPFVMFNIQSHSISRSIFCCRKLRLRLNFKYRWTVTFFHRQFIAVGVVGRSQIFIDETSARMFDVISAVVRNM